MALFGKGSVPSLIKKLQSDPQLGIKEITDILDEIRFSAEFAVDQHPWLFTHPQKKVRDFALQELRSPVPPALVEAITKQMVGQRSDIRRDLAAVIAKVAPERIGPLLAKLMTAEESVERETGLDLIARSGDFKQYLGHLKTALRDPVSKVRQKTVRILASDALDPTVALILRDLIHDGDDTVRHLVIEAVAKNPSPDIIEPFFHRLSHETPETRSVMMRALRQVMKGAARQVEREILPLLGDEDAQIREIAVKLLGELPDQLRVLRSFLLHCQGLAFWLRERSIESIQSISNDLVPALVELIGDEDRDVRVGAMQMCKTANDPRLFPAIRDLFLSQEDWWVRSMAAEVLANYRTPEATQALLERFEDAELRYSVIPALGEQKTPAAIQALVGTLEDSNRGIRMQAMRALEGCKSPEVIERLRRVGLAEKDDEARSLAAQVLRGLGVTDEVLLNRLENNPAVEAVPADPNEPQLEMANQALHDIE